MRNPKRIDIILSKINFAKFIKSNTQGITDTAAESLSSKIAGNLDSIRKSWKSSPDMRLGQLLICNGYAPDNYRLFNVEEDDWMIENGTPIEEVKFWGSNYDINGKRLNETVYRLLRDLDDGHIQAILDLEEEGFMKVNEDYKTYFKSRLSNVKI